MLSIKSRFFSKVHGAFSLSSYTEDQKTADNYSSPSAPVGTGHEKWFFALKQVFPLYFAISIACLVISLLALMSSQVNGDPRYFSFHLLWQGWNHWDTVWYMRIAEFGYNAKERTAFFPLYPLLVRGMMYLLHSPLLAGLFIANITMLGTFIVFYRLIDEDFGPERATRAIFYMAVFPTGFFLTAAYNTSLSLCLALLCFYAIRRRNWWLAAIFGLFASLTRSDGVLLAFPFLYEYLRQHQFRWRSIRVDIASIIFIPVGVILFGVYCYYQFGDFLAFSHVEILWGRQLEVPWYGIKMSIHYIRTSPGLLSYQSLNNFLNLIPDLLFLIFGILGFIGPWRFPRSHWSYAIYAVIFWIFVNLVPVTNFPYPLASMGRYFLESFPTFILLAAWGKNRFFHITYFFVCGPICVYLLMHHLLGLPVI
ncbi:MAG TPA: glycosyltransferase family 39 protein [Ktedonobacteraceae bacterium]